MRRSKRCPQYLVIGDSQSGKKQLLLASGLTWHPSTWRCESGHFHLHTLSPDSSDKLLELSTQLKQANKNQPLNGVIIALAANDLTTSSTMLWHRLGQALNTLTEQLQSRLPIYIVITKADFIRGFVSFFKDLGQEELQDILGFTNPLQVESSQIVTSTTEQMSRWIALLRQQMIWALENETNTTTRTDIFNFPEQCHALKNILMDGLRKLNQQVGTQQSCQWRGIYLTSAIQQATAVDFIAHAIRHDKHAGEILTVNAATSQESYFIHKLFHQVILQEGPWLGYQYHRQRQRRLLQQALMYGAPIISLLFSVIIWHSYTQQQSLIKQTKQVIHQHHQLMRQFDFRNQQLEVVQHVFTPWQNLKAVVQTSGWMRGAFVSHYLLRNAIQAVSNRLLQSLLLPRVAIALEQQLQQPEQYDNDTLYSLLKGYMAFSPNAATEGNSIVLPMQLLFGFDLADRPWLLQHLLQSIHDAAALPFTALPIKRAVIDRIRDRLQRDNPVVRVIAILNMKAITHNMQPLCWAKAHQTLFEHQTNQHCIPALYTKQGFQHILLPYLSQAAKQVNQDNQLLGLRTDDTMALTAEQLQQRAYHYYQQQYRLIWQQQWQSLILQKAHGLSELEKQLNILLSEPYPLATLAVLLQNNKPPFGNQWYRLDNLKSIQQALRQLRDAIKAIALQPNPNRASYVFLRQFMLGDPRHPLRQMLVLESSISPASRHFLHQVLQQSWYCLAQLSRNYLNQQWQTKIIDHYQQYIVNRFPIAQHAENEIDLAHFKEFFAPNGRLALFAQKMLDPFITKQSSWQNATVGGLNLGLSPELLQALRQAAQIRQAWFIEGRDTPESVLTITPKYLSPHLSNIKLTVGDQTLQYQFGPPIPITVRWPMTIPQVKIHGQRFNGTSFDKQYSGDWGLWRFIADSHPRDSDHPNQVMIRIAALEALAEFNIKSEHSDLLFKMHVLQHWQLPTHL